MIFLCIIHRPTRSEMHSAVAVTCEIFVVISLAFWPHARVSPAVSTELPEPRRSSLCRVPRVTPRGGQARQWAPAWSSLSRTKTLQSPKRCWSVRWGCVFSPTMLRSAFIGPLTAALLLPRAYIHLCIYMCVCVHTEYTRTYQPSDGISKASSLTLHVSGTSGGSPVSPGAVTTRVPQLVRGTCRPEPPAPALFPAAFFLPHVAKDSFSLLSRTHWGCNG